MLNVEPKAGNADTKAQEGTDAPVGKNNCVTIFSSSWHASNCMIGKLYHNIDTTLQPFRFFSSLIHPPHAPINQSFSHSVSQPLNSSRYPMYEPIHYLSNQLTGLCRDNPLTDRHTDHQTNQSGLDIGMGPRDSDNLCFSGRIHP